MQQGTQPVRSKRIWENIYDWMDAILFAFVAVILLSVFVFRVVYVSGESMQNTLYEGERLLISDLFYKPQYKDIVVVVRPEDELEPLIKRVIATEGQLVEVDYDNGVVRVDGVELDEPHIKEAMNKTGAGVLQVEVPKGEVFVMGDNRNHSLDSRMIGTVPEQYILGKVYLRLLPLNKFGGVA